MLCDIHVYTIMQWEIFARKSVTYINLYQFDVDVIPFALENNVNWNNIKGKILVSSLYVIIVMVYLG